jgi:hypothetical protein
MGRHHGVVLGFNPIPKEIVMIALQTLWLPVLLSSVFVFIASCVVHMALPWWHKSDYAKLPNEDKFSEAVRPLSIPPGDYMVPSCDTMAEMRTPEFQEKMMKGPRMFMTVLPNGPFTMGKSMTLWFLYVVVISCFAAYVSFYAVPLGEHHHKHILRFAGVTAALGYAGALCQFSIWYSRSWVTTIKSGIDGLLYATITAATQAWLWPK